MKQIHLHNQARRYALDHIEPLTAKGKSVDLVTHLQYFALLMIREFADQNDITIIIKTESK